MAVKVKLFLNILYFPPLLRPVTQPFPPLLNFSRTDKIPNNEFSFTQNSNQSRNLNNVFMANPLSLSKQFPLANHPTSFPCFSHSSPLSHSPPFHGRSSSPRFQFSIQSNIFNFLFPFLFDINNFLPLILFFAGSPALLPSHDAGARGICYACTI